MITCVYPAVASYESNKQDVPRIILNRAVLSFNPHIEGHMLVQLTFTND